MKKQVVFIHGGSAYSNYDDFLKALQTTPIDPLRPPAQRWKHTLAEDLGDAFAVYQPQMPNRENAKYLEWKLWFERYREFLQDGVVLIGHSQGGYFLTKYLTENTLGVTIRALYLIASPFCPVTTEGEDGGDFNFDPAKLGYLEQQVGDIVVMHSTDDPVVSYAHAMQYKNHLVNATLMDFAERGHFLSPTFPELIAHIRSIF